MATAALIILLTATLGLLASVVMTRASNHSAIANMGFAVALLFALILLLYALARLITWMTIS